MVKRVPYQSVPSVELQAGSEVQFSGGTVTPMQDVVTDDIERFGKAQTQLGQTLTKLDDELNDAEAKKLYNALHEEIQGEVDNYTNLEGANAVLSNGKTIEGDPKNAFDDTNKNIENILKKYTDQSSNGMVKYMLENMSQVSIKSAQNKITQHSIKQQRLLKQKESKAKINTHRIDSIQSITRFNEPGSDYWTSFGSGIAEIQAYALDQNWNIDPSKGEVSWQYLEMLQDYTTKIYDSALEWFGQDEKTAELGKKYFEVHAQGIPLGGTVIQILDGKTTVQALATLEKKQSDACAVKICNNILEYEGNSNNNNFLHQANLLMTLDSNNTTDNGNGSAVIDGQNADQMENVEATSSENIESLQQARATSKYYNPESTSFGGIIPQHQTVHLFAIQKLGVEKADTLYSNAVKDADIDQDKYENDQAYFVAKNQEIIANFNKSFIAEVDQAYTPKVQELTKTLEKLQKRNSKMKSKGVYVKKKKELKLKIAETKEELNLAKEQSSKYIDTTTNDLLILNKEINYDHVDGQAYVEVNPKTQLPPLKFFEDKIIATIKDPEKQKVALEELKFNYRKKEEERLNRYNGAYLNAQDIAFSEPDGWKLLKANGIDINMFTKEDQIALKGGHPPESDINAVVEIEQNEEEILTDENKLKVYMPKLNKGQYEYYVNQLNKAKTNKAKSAGLKVDPEIFHSALIENDLGNLVDASKSSHKDHEKYLKLKMAYRDRLNFYYDNGIEINYDKRKAIIKEILTDEVIYDGRIKNNTKSFFQYKTSDFDQLFIEVDTKDGDTVAVYLNDIPMNLQSRIQKALLNRGLPPTYQNMAQEYYDTGRPKDTDTYEKSLKINMMRGY